MKRMIFFSMLVGIHGASWCAEGRKWELWQCENLVLQAALDGNAQAFISCFSLWEKIKKEKVACMLEWTDEKKIEEVITTSKNNFMQKLALTIAGAKATGHEEKCFHYLNKQGLDLQSGPIGYPQNGGVALVSKIPPKQNWLMKDIEITTLYEEMPVTPLLVALWRGKHEIASLLAQQIGDSEIHLATAKACAAFAIIRRCYPVLEILLKKSPQLLQDKKNRDIFERLACMRLSVPAMMMISKENIFEPQVLHFGQGIQAHYEVGHGVTNLPSFFSMLKPLVQGFTIKGKITKTEHADLVLHLEKQKRELNQLMMQESAAEETYFVKDCSVHDIFRGYDNIVTILMAKRKKQFDYWQRKDGLKNMNGEQLRPLNGVCCLFCNEHVWSNSVKLCLSQDCAMHKPLICDNHIFRRDEVMQKYGCKECKGKSSIDYNYIGFRLNQKTEPLRQSLKIQDTSNN
jgi:hypothetical protein